MLRSHLVIACLVVVWVSLLGCGPKIELVRFETAPPLPPRAADCALTVFEVGDDLPEGYARNALLFVGAGGGTQSCDRDSMRARLEQEACLAGAGAVRIVRAREPGRSGATHCHQFWAELLVSDD